MTAYWKLFFAMVFFATALTAEAKQRYTVKRPVTPVASTPFFEPITVYWETDFAAAIKLAKEQRRNLLIYYETVYDFDSFQQPVIASCRTFEQTVLGDPQVYSALSQYILLKLPMLEVRSRGERTGFSIPGYYPEPMEGHPGLALVDYENTGTPYYAKTVAMLPFIDGESGVESIPTAKETLIFLSLPSAGTLSQRMMVYAVRCHPSKPLSTEGIPHTVTLAMATEQAAYQAKKMQVSHANYSERSHRAIESLGGTGSPSEICSQGSYGKGLFEACFDCARMWRNSSAHWNIMRKEHTYYGFDVRRGKDGGWYGTGFFIDK